MTAATIDDVTLPPALRGLAPELEQLAPDVVVALRPLLARLLVALSTSSPAVVDDDGEPDGHRGFVRRGPWSRLVLSEWALLDEVPDEFLRRVAAGEQLFHELERTQPRAPGAFVVLFDVGGNQLGRCHLVQLAIAIVLAARARERGATLLCGVLSTSTTTKLLRPFSAALLLQLQQARARDAVDVVVCDAVAVVVEAAIAERLGPHARRDVVVIGGARTMTALSSSTAPLWQRAQGVVLQDAYTPDAAVMLTTSRTTTAAKTVTLSLPDDATCTRLLRDPLQRRVSTTTTHKAARQRHQQLAIDTHHRLIASARGDRLLTRLVDGDIVSIAVPEKPSTPPSWGRTMRVHETLAAVGAQGRHLEAAVVTGNTDVAIVAEPRRHIVRCAMRPPRAATPSAFGMLAGAHRWRPLLDVDNTLFIVDQDNERVSLRAEHQRLLVSRAHATIVRLDDNHVHDGAPSWALVRTTPTGDAVLLVRPRLGEAGSTVAFDVSDHTGAGVVAHVGESCWALVREGRDDVVGRNTAIPAEHVVGVYVQHQRVQLVARDAPSSIVILGGQHARVSFERPIAQTLIVHGHLPQLFVLTDDGALHTLLLPSLQRLLVRSAVQR